MSTENESAPEAAPDENENITIDAEAASIPGFDWTPPITSFDRPGELIEKSFRAAGDHLRVEPALLHDPRDDTQAPFVVGRDGITPIDPAHFDAYRDRPLRRVGISGHTRLDSFIAHVNRFKAENSVVFAQDDMDAPGLTAVFDYHPAGGDTRDTEAMRHRATYAFPLSEEWKAWAEADGQKMNMIDFAAFLEDRIVDVVADAKPSSPAAIDFMNKTGGNLATPTRLIEISRTLHVNENAALRSTHNLSSGEAEVMFKSEHVDGTGAKLVLPNLFMICVPVFARSKDFYQILARFRYRASGGSLAFWYELWRADLVFEQAFSDACDAVRAETGLPLFVGHPEA